jgi:hypothetical protein
MSEKMKADRAEKSRDKQEDKGPLGNVESNKYRGHLAIEVSAAPACPLDVNLQQCVAT